MQSLIRNWKKREGFTLIELMIVVAIIGILAAIAIPNFIKFQLRSKASEGKINLAGIRTAQESYFAEVGTYTSWTATPASGGGQVKVGWGVDCTANPLSGMCQIGWSPEGDIYYQYAVVVNNPGSQSNQFFAAGQSDIDGDTNLNTWGILKPDITGTADLQGAGPFGCSDIKNVADPAQNVLSQVGPCDNVDNGRNVF